MIDRYRDHLDHYMPRAILAHYLLDEEDLYEHGNKFTRKFRLL